MNQPDFDFAAKQGLPTQSRSGISSFSAKGLLLSANQNDMGFDFVVAGNSGTEVSPLAVDLDALVPREFGLSHGFSSLVAMPNTEEFPFDPI